MLRHNEAPQLKDSVLDKFLDSSLSESGSIIFEAPQYSHLFLKMGQRKGVKVLRANMGITN